MKKLFANLFGHTKRAECKRRTPGLETLENRANPSSFVSNGDLYIHGTAGADNVTIRYEKRWDDSYFVVTENGQPAQLFQTSSLWGGDVHFQGYAGDDVFNASAVGHSVPNSVFLRINAYGGDGHDTLFGGASRDMLDGGNGSDTLFGGQQADLLYGGSDFGFNALYGGGGNDTMYGGYGVDYMYGEDGVDSMDGNWGDDYLDGGIHTDYLYGNGGNDTLVAGYDYSYNHLDGGYGNDTMYGGYGDDSMYGQDGDDHLAGNWGNDQMFGGMGMDRLYGQAGNDYLDGGHDGIADYLEGDVGADRFEQEVVWVQYGQWYYSYNRDTPFDYDPYGQLDQMVNLS